MVALLAVITDSVLAHLEGYTVAVPAYKLPSWGIVYSGEGTTQDAITPPLLSCSAAELWGQLLTQITWGIVQVPPPDTGMLGTLEMVEAPHPSTWASSTTVFVERGKSETIMQSPVQQQGPRPWPQASGEGTGLGSGVLKEE